MRNLEKRLEKLEEVYSPAEITVIMLTHFGQGEIKGWKGEGIYIARDPGESEEALACRAAVKARECKDFCVCELYVTLEGGSNVWLPRPTRSSLS